MQCLSEKQLARRALGLTEHADLAAHLDECAVCRAGLEMMQALAHQLTVAHARLEQGHEEARSRLLALLPAASRRPEPVTSRNPILHWIGGLNVRQRLMLGGMGVGLAAVLALLLLWGSSPKPVSAMERMAEQIRQAKSCKYSGVTQGPVVPEPGKPPVTETIKWTRYWLAPGSLRGESKASTVPPGALRGPQLLDYAFISPAGKPGIFIDHEKKTFWRQPACLGDDSSYFDAPMRIQGLGEFSGQADRELGTRQINGKKARGFEIDARKMDPDSEPMPVEIWIDVESSLPVLVRFEMKWPDGPATVQMMDFEWNTPLDPKLFDPTPPEGYTNATPKPRPLEEIVGEITEALRIYADASGGHYPRVKRVLHGQAIEDQLRNMLGIAWPAGTAQESEKGNAAKLAKARPGLMGIEGIQRQNPDAAYYGNTVGPKDKDSALLRWKLDDGKYAVIFGDLRSETVTVERLRLLEGK